MLSPLQRLRCQSLVKILLHLKDHTPKEQRHLGHCFKCNDRKNVDISFNATLSESPLLSFTKDQTSTNYRTNSVSEACLNVKSPPMLSRRTPTNLCKKPVMTTNHRTISVLKFCGENVYTFATFRL